MAILDSYDVATASAPSNLNREQVYNAIVDISKIPLPFQDAVGRSSHTNTFFEWSADRLADPDTTNAVVDGSDAPSPEVSPAIRVGNYGQISQKTVSTSTRLEAANNVGSESLARQIAKATNELQRDMEAILLLNQANRQDTGGKTGTAGLTAGLEAWLDPNVWNSTVISSPVAKSPSPLIDGASAGSVSFGGWSNKTGNIIDTIDYTGLTTAGALSFADLQTVVNALYELGGGDSGRLVLMARPAVVEAISDFMFTSTAKIAAPVKDVGRAGGTPQMVAATNSWLSNHGIVIDMVPNRLMQQSGDGTPNCDTVFIMDPSYISVSYQGGGIRTKELPASGLFRSVQIHADYGLCVKNADTLGAVVAIDPTAAVTA